MTLTQKLQGFAQEIDNKLLDSNLKLENGYVLFQIRSYLKDLLSTSSGGGGGGVDNTTQLNAIKAVLDDINLKTFDDTSELNGIITELESTVSFLANINLKITSTEAHTQSISSDISQILTNTSNLDSKLSTTNTKIDDLIAKQEHSVTLTSTSVTISTNSTAQLLIAESTTRKYLLVQNNSDSNDVWIGFSNSVTSTNGLFLPRGSSFESNKLYMYKGDIWGYKTSGNGQLTLITGVAA